MVNIHCKRAVSAAVACALAVAAATPRSAFAQEAPAGDAAPLQEVVVTGSYIKRPADRPQPLTVLDSQALDDSQRTTIADSLRDLPQNVGAMTVVNTQGGGVDGGNSPTSTVNLRGLGAGATLVLLNGERQIADGGYGYVDVNNLAPSIMIDRVETVTDGASALYGSDAVAGVVNFITKKNFEGFEVKTDFQRIQDTTSDRPDMNLGMLWGAHNDATSIVAGFEYASTQHLLADERFDASRLKLGLSSGFGNPATYQYQVKGALTSSTIADPLCGSSLLGNGGPSGLANGLVSTLGPNTTCQLYNALGRSLQPDSQRMNGMVTAEHKFSDTITGDFEVGFARTRYQIPFGYVTPETTAATLYPIVPLNNPGIAATLAELSGTAAQSFRNVLNTAGLTGLAYRGRVLSPWLNNGDDGAIQQSGQDTYRVGGKLLGKFGDTGFDWNVGFTQSWNSTTFGTNDTIINRMSLAVNGYGGSACAYTPATDPTKAHQGAGTCQWFNPFAVANVAGAPASAQNAPGLLNWIYGLRTTDDVGQLRTYDAVTTGKLFDLPGGATSIAVGVERRELSFSQTWDSGSHQIGYWGFNTASFANSDFFGSNATNAAFAEIVAYPIKPIEMDLAGRYERTGYANGGTFGKFDPKLSLLWTPVKSLFVRASVGTSFQAPGPANLYAQAQGGSSADTLGGQGIIARGLLLGNPNLKPETSQNWNLGVTWDITPDLSVDLNYFNIKFKNLITAENAEAILLKDEATGYINDPTHIVLAAGAPNEVCEVTRGYTPAKGALPAGCINGTNIIAFDTTYVNSGFLHTNGLDYEVKYKLKADSIGMQFPLRLYGTFTHEYLMQQVTGSTITLYNGVGSYNDSTPVGTPMPHYTANLEASAIRGSHALIATVRFIPAMDLQLPTASNVGTQSEAFTTLDLLYRYQLPWGKGNSSVTASILNVTNVDPPIAGGAQTTVYSDTYPILGRVFRVGAELKF